MMRQPNYSNTIDYLMGVDGGGTRCRVRLASLEGAILAEATAGSANIFQNHKKAWHSLQQATSEALKQANLEPSALHQTAVVAGLAGAEVETARKQFLALVQGFAHFELLTDAQTACLGAHQGRDGAIFIIGTGTIGIKKASNEWVRVGGWGFPLSDEGSGAWLGMQAVRCALKSHDGIQNSSHLSEQVWAHFEHNPSALLEWSISASSGDYGQLAPLVLEAFQQHDPAAQLIIEQQINIIAQHIRALTGANQPLALMGGLADWVSNHLPIDIKDTLVQPHTDALSGALLRAQQGLSL